MKNLLFPLQLLPARICQPQFLLQFLQPPGRTADLARQPAGKRPGRPWPGSGCAARPPGLRCVPAARPARACAPPGHAALCSPACGRLPRRRGGAFWAGGAPVCAGLAAAVRLFIPPGSAAASRRSRPRIRSPRPPVQHQHAGDQVVQESPVVADQQQRAADSPAAGLPASPASRYPGRWSARPAPAGWPGGPTGAPAAAGCAPRPTGR